MKGVPTNPVPCRGCGGHKGCPADRLCHSCRMKSRAPANKKFFWTAEMDERLRRLYRGAHNRKELIAGLDHFRRLCGFPRSAITARAAELSLSRPTGRPWTELEIERLRDAVGSRSEAAIARSLGRSYYAVKGRLARLRISGRRSEGYTQQDLEFLLGVGHKRIQTWISRNWIQVRDGRVPEHSVAQFLQRHPEEYQLGRVDEAWFKGLVFPSFNHAPVARMESALDSGSRAADVDSLDGSRLS